MGERGDLFLIDCSQWKKACSLGLGPAIAYLILARGTGPDNSITSWMAKSIEKYTGIGRKRAGQYIDALRAAGLVRTSPKVNGWPRFALTLPKKPEWIFLPNSIIDGAAGEVSPIERLRRRGSLEAVRMLVAAYEMHDLANDGGLDHRQISIEFKRKLITKRGLWSIFGFDQGPISILRSCPLHRLFPLTDEGTEAFWQTLAILEETGLIQMHPHVVEGDFDGAELLFPVDCKGSEVERELFEAVTDAAVAMLDDSSGYKFELEKYEIVVPINCDWPNATVVGVYRLRYRPKTKATAYWWSKQNEWENFKNAYTTLANSPREAAQIWESAPSKIVQSE